MGADTAGKVSSPAQRRVLELLLEGLAAADIAEELKISVASVRNHTAAIYKALDVHSQAEVLALAIEHLQAQGPPAGTPDSTPAATSVATAPAQHLASGTSHPISAYRESLGPATMRPPLVRTAPPTYRPMTSAATSTERVAIFIDGQNFSRVTYEGLGIRVDFKRLLSTLVGTRILIRSLYYIGEWSQESLALLRDVRRVRSGADVSVPPEDPDEPERRAAQQQGFIRMLNRNGYAVVKKPIRVFADGGAKGDLAVETTVDMLTLAPRCDRMVLVSGDPDFIPAVRAVQRLGVRVQVVGSQQPHAYDSTAERPRAFPGRASDELLDAADEFIEVRDLIPAIELEEARRARPFRPTGPTDEAPATN